MVSILQAIDFCLVLKGLLVFSFSFVCRHKYPCLEAIPRSTEYVQFPFYLLWGCPKMKEARALTCKRWCQEPVPVTHGFVKPDRAVPKLLPAGQEGMGSPARNPGGSLCSHPKRGFIPAGISEHLSDVHGNTGTGLCSWLRTEHVKRTQRWSTGTFALSWFAYTVTELCFGCCPGPLAGLRHSICFSCSQTCFQGALLWLRAGSCCLWALRLCLFCFQVPGAAVPALHPAQGTALRQPRSPEPACLPILPDLGYSKYLKLISWYRSMVCVILPKFF